MKLTIYHYHVLMMKGMYQKTEFICLLYFIKIVIKNAIKSFHTFIIFMKKFYTQKKV